MLMISSNTGRYQSSLSDSQLEIWADVMEVVQLEFLRAVANMNGRRGETRAAELFSARPQGAKVPLELVGRTAEA